MTKISELREIIYPPEEVVQAAMNGDLVMFVGSGISMLLGLPSWKGLAAAVFDDLRQAGLLNYSEIEQLKTLDAKKQLSIAKLIAEDYKHPFDLVKHFQDRREGNSIYKALNDIGSVCVTTNYDELLAPRFKETADGSTTPIAGARILEQSKIYPHNLDDPGTVIHLHGAISNPGTMVVTTEDYLKHYDNEHVQVFLDALFTRKTVVFVGYGLDEAEILEHILRRGSATTTKGQKRFVLQGFFQSQRHLFEHLHRYYEKSFSMKLLGFLRDHQDYDCQAGIIEHWSQKLKVRKPPLATDTDSIDEVCPDD